MRRSLRPALVFLVALSVASPVAPAFAAEPTQEEETAARAQFKAAQSLYDQGDFASALLIFEDVFETVKSPNVALYIARCLRDAGRLPEAYERFSWAIAEASAKAETEERFASTRAAAAAERAAIEGKIGRVTVAMVEKPEGLVVEFAGAPVAAERFGERIATAPGRVRVTAKAPGFEPFLRDLTVDAGATVTVAIALSPAAAAAVEPVAPPPKPERRPPPETSPAPAPQEDDTTLRNVGFVVAGLGLAGLATFGITGSMAEEKYSVLYDKCGGARCTDPADSDEVDAGKTLDLVANISLVAGSAALASGVAMIIFGSVGGRASETTSLRVSPQGASVGYRGHF